MKEGGRHYSPLEVGFPIELKNSQLLDLRDFHERYAELSDYSQLTHYLHISAPVAIGYVTKDRTPEGNLQSIFHLDNGCYLRTMLEDVIDCDGDLYHGIIWATRRGAALVILTRKVEYAYWDYQLSGNSGLRRASDFGLCVHLQWG